MTSRRQAIVLFCVGPPFVDGDPEVGLVQPHQMLDRRQVRRQPLERPFLLRRVRNRDFDRAVEPQLAFLHLFQQFDRPLQHEIVAEQQVAERRAGFFDSRGRRDLVRPA